MEYIEEIKKDDQIIAIIIYHDFNKGGIEFFTPGEFSQQLGYMKHEAGYKIQQHTHKLHERKVKYTQETLFIKSGQIRVDFYTDEAAYLCSRELKQGDVILLASGGHGFECLEETEMIEVKQGPYYGEEDKVRFKGV